MSWETSSSPVEQADKSSFCQIQDERRKYLFLLCSISTYSWSCFIVVIESISAITAFTAVFTLLSLMLVLIAWGAAITV